MVGSEGSHPHLPQVTRDGACIAASHQRWAVLCGVSRVLKSRTAPKFATDYPSVCRSRAHSGVERPPLYRDASNVVTPVESAARHRPSMTLSLLRNPGQAAKPGVARIQKFPGLGTIECVVNDLYNHVLRHARLNYLSKIDLWRQFY